MGDEGRGVSGPATAIAVALKSKDGALAGATSMRTRIASRRAAGTVVVPGNPSPRKMTSG